MAETSLAMAVAVTLVGAAAFLAIIWFLLPYVGSRACAACGSRQAYRAAACEVCGAAMPGPPEAHPGARPYGFPRPAGPEPETGRTRVEGGEAFNRGITRRVVTVATAAMGLGIGLRVLGMLGALGLPQVPLFVDGILTIAGGLIAFVGFVFLDAA